MKKIAILDVSMFIWDETHFEENKVDYYKIIGPIVDIFKIIEDKKIPIAINAQLINEIHCHFPYTKIQANGFYYFEQATLLFLTRIAGRAIPYENVNTEEINSIPDLCKKFYESTTKTEIRYLITYLYKNKVDVQKFLTFFIFYNYEYNLIIKNGNTVEIETILCDSINEQEIVSKFKNIFEHNPKHNAHNVSRDRATDDKYVSPLSCYNERIGDKAEAQNLLDNSVYYKNDYINYDKINRTFVKFVLTRDNVYHGFDVQLSEEEQSTINELLKNE